MTRFPDANATDADGNPLFIDPPFDAPRAPRIILDPAASAAVAFLDTGDDLDLQPLTRAELLALRADIDAAISQLQ